MTHDLRMLAPRPFHVKQRSALLRVHYYQSRFGGPATRDSPLVAFYNDGAEKSSIENRSNEGMRAVNRSYPRFAWSIYELSADRKSTRLNSSHVAISYAVFCLKKKKLQ